MKRSVPNLIHSILISSFLLLSLSSLSAEDKHQEIRFSATGCGPYKAEEERDLARYVSDENLKKEAEFMVHLGDIMSGYTPATEDRYVTVADILKQAQLTSFIIPGDNEWNDKKDPDAAWALWEKYFMHFHKRWTKGTAKAFPKIQGISYQKKRPENFAFLGKGVLFIGLNLPGGRVHDKKEWDLRLPQNAKWVADNLKKHQTNARALVIFAHAHLNNTHEAFTKPFLAAAEAFAKPVLYLHADGHTWIKDHPWAKHKNVLRVQTEQIDLAPPVLVTVKSSGTTTDIFEFDRRYQRGPYLAKGKPDGMTVVWRIVPKGKPSIRIGLSPTETKVPKSGLRITKKVYEKDKGNGKDAKTLASDRDKYLFKAPKGIVQYEAEFSGLKPGTQYFYSVYDGDRRIAGGQICRFKTHPPAGSKTPLRFWVVGDSGKGNQDQADVHNAMVNFTKRHKKPLDFYVHVGDMAYNTGKDHEFQQRFFSPYDLTLRNTVCWPAMGNHEGYTSRGLTGIGPYYDAYVLPSKGESGGLPSGTEAYYSFDYGNIHFVCLDSHDLVRTPDGAMAKWLK
ncbi:MAG: metallophosphoesterase family protein, partial [Lentisphaeria bacterium]|nr:metallophosphoesterase family protein [Lentisphaeria bacterium]